MATQAQIDAAFATIREAQITIETAIAEKLAEVVGLIDGATGLYPGGLSKTLCDLRNVADLIGTQLTPTAA